MRSLDEILLEGIQAGQIGTPIEPHGLHAMGFFQFLDADTDLPRRCADIGTGVGLPGLVLAERYPATTWTLIERRSGRTDLLRRGVTRLGLASRVEVFTGDVVNLARGTRRGSFDCVTARSFGPPADTAECALGLLAEGGSLITSEPFGDETESRWPAADLQRCGLALVEEWETTHGRYLRFVRDSQRLDHLPRPGARKRLLF